MSAPTDTNTPKEEEKPKPIETVEVIAHKGNYLNIKCAFCSNCFFMEEVNCLLKFSCLHCGTVLELNNQMKAILRKKLGLVK